MKVYAGDRTIDGVMVTVDGEPLDEHAGMPGFSRGGFEWSYEGNGPSQLAYAILANHFGDARKAAELQARFMRAAVANFQNEWEMTSADIERMLKTML